MPRGPPLDRLNRLVLSGLVHCGPAAVPVLTNYLDPARYDPTVRHEIYLKLAYLPLVIHAREAVPILKLRAESGEDMDRVLASFTLVQMDTNFHAFSVSNLVTVLQKTNSINRVSAASFLAGISPIPIAAKPVMTAALNDPDPQVRRTAERFLERLSREEEKAQKEHTPLLLQLQP